MMRKWPKVNLSSKTRLIAIVVIALLLPTVVLSAIQFRSLVDLEDKTKVAVQENMRQTLQTISRKVEENLKWLARKNLGDIGLADLEPQNAQALERRFAAIKQEHPEIDSLFAFSTCQQTQKYNGLFYTDGGLRRLDWPAIEASPEAYAAYKAFYRAFASRTPDSKTDYLFWQTSCCQDSANKDSSKFQEFIFRPLLCCDTKDCLAFSGFSLKPSYIADTYLPQMIPALLRSCDIDDKDSALALGILDERSGELYTNRTGKGDYEVKMTFAPAFPQWKLALGYKNTTIEQLAKDNFTKNLLLTLLLLSILILGIILTLRATSREMKLAEAKSTFVSNVSHELKTPLALIRLFAETLELGRVKNAEKAHEYHRIINSESRRLTQLINNILDFSKIEAGRKEYQFIESDVAEVVEDVLKSYDYQITSAGFELTTDIAPDLPPVAIDRDAISQAVLNLVNNAVKYSDDVKKISVRLRRRDGFVAMEVADQGIGIPRSEQEKIFEKFYRVSTGLVHDTKGSGLGLALVKHIVEAHKGKIQLESAPGRGSRFTILIPANGVERASTPVKYDGGYQVAESANH
jgi:signal transduction histidine kinase